MSLGFGVGSGFRASGLRFGVENWKRRWKLPLRVSGCGFKLRLQGLGFRALSFVFGVDDLIAGGQ